jgi:hypothetical protein
VGIALGHWSFPVPISHSTRPATDVLIAINL